MQEAVNYPEDSLISYYQFFLGSQSKYILFKEVPLGFFFSRMNVWGGAKKLFMSYYTISKGCVHFLN